MTSAPDQATGALTLLLERLRGLTYRRSGVSLALWGEAGVGKSFTARRLLADLPLKSVSVHATAPLPALLLALPRPQKLPAWLAHALDKLQADPQSEVSSPELLLTGLLSASAPFVLHAEDWHEADTERKAFWVEVGAAVQCSRGVGLLITSRTPLPEPFEVVQWQPLGRAESDALLTSQVSAPLPAPALEWIYAHAAGNPLFTLEYFRFLAQRGFAWNDGQQWRWRTPDSKVVPATIEAILERRLLEIGGKPTVRDALDALAFLPAGVPEEVVQAVAGLSEADWQAALAELAQQHLVKAGQWAHPLYREVTLHALPVTRRRELARRVQQVQTDPLLAVQYVQQAGLSAAETFKVYQQAASVARGEQMRAQLLTAALPFAPPEQWASLALEAAQTLNYYDSQQAINLTRQVLERNPDLHEATYLLARMLAQYQQDDRALEVLATLPPADQQSLRGLEAQIEVLGYLGRRPELLALFAEYEQTVPFGMQAIKWVIGMLSALHQWDRAEALIPVALARGDPTTWEYAHFHNGMGLMYQYKNDFEKADYYFRLTCELIESRFEGRRLYVVLGNCAITSRHLGQMEEAEKAAWRAYQLAQETGDPLNAARAGLRLLDCALGRGNYSSAEEQGLQSCLVYDALPESLESAEAHGLLSEVYCNWGLPINRFLALKHAHEALRQGRVMGVPDFLSNGLHWAALAEAQYGKPAQALKLAEEGLQVAQAYGNPTNWANAHWAMAEAQAVLGNIPLALEHFQQSMTASREMGSEELAQLQGLRADIISGNVAGIQQRQHWFQERGLGNGMQQAARALAALTDMPPTSNPPVALTWQVQALGPLTVSGPDGAQPVRGSQRQKLLLLLLEARVAGRGSVSRLDLIDALYPDLDETAALASLKTNVFKTRKAHAEQLIQTTSDGYALGVGSDLEVFLAGGDLSLWRGAYAGLAHDLPAGVQESLHLALLRRVQEQVGDPPAEAVRLGALLHESEPYSLPALRLYCQALHRAGQPQMLSKVYERARATYAQMGEALPTDWAQLPAN